MSVKECKICIISLISTHYYFYIILIILNLNNFWNITFYIVLKTYVKNINKNSCKPLTSVGQLIPITSGKSILNFLSNIRPFSTQLCREDLSWKFWSFATDVTSFACFNNFCFRNYIWIRIKCLLALRGQPFPMK